MPNPTYIHSEVMPNGKEVEIGLSCNAGTMVVKVDRATASRLINQLRRVLDDSYNQAINQREENVNAI